jgi:xylulokinase
LHRDHTRADLIRAVVEGISYGTRFVLENLQSRTGHPSVELRCVGGGTRNPFWQQVKADIIGEPIDTPAIADITAQGAALLAGIGAGAFSDEIDGARKAYRSAVRYDAEPERHAFYDTEYHRVFTQLKTLYQTVSLT